jgi:hypothetical protein
MHWMCKECDGSEKNAQILHKQVEEAQKLMAKMLCQKLAELFSFLEQSRNHWHTS